MNPFILQGYRGPDLFCDRKQELRELIGHVENGRNMVLYGERRMGKTALLHRLLDGRPGMLVDLLSCQSLHEAVEKIARALVEREGIMNARENNLWQRLLAHFEVRITADAITGAPTASLRLGRGQAAAPALEHIGAYLARLEPGFVLCLDEFQQITRFEGENAEAVFREWMQSFPEVRFAFSGSHGSMMRAMFNAHHRPFYQSCEIMELLPVPLAEYRPFIQRHFEADGRVATDAVVEAVYHWARGTTHWIQAQCNRLYDRVGNPSVEATWEVQESILASQQSYMGQILNQLPSAQASLLKALAQHPTGVQQPMAMSFLQAHGLPAASSVNSALKGLDRSNLVMRRTDGAWQLADPLFAEWLRRG